MTAVANNVAIEATLTRRRMQQGNWQPVSMETVRDKLSAREQALEPRDIQLPGNHWHFRMPNGGRAQIARLTEAGIGPDMGLTKNGLLQLCSTVLPSYGFKFLQELSNLPDPKPGFHRSLAEGIFNRFLAHDSKNRKFRTVDLPGHGRTVRAVLSEGYTTVDDLDLLGIMLDIPEFRNLPVISVDSTDTLTRIKFGLYPGNGSIAVNRPIPIGILSNSEVGRRAVRFEGGMFKLMCTNGMGHWDKKLAFRWNHTGNFERISAGLQDAFWTVRTQASGVIEAYERASTIFLDDMGAFMKGLNASLPRDVQFSGRQVERVKASLADPTNTRSDSGLPVLATVVDAITLAAQSEKNIEKTEGMEEAAAYVMARGLDAGDVIRIDTTNEEAPLIVW